MIYFAHMCALSPPFPLQTPFSELQPDALNGQVLKYAKAVYQLEKGLPPNAVVPKLKAKVEDMKDKVVYMCTYNIRSKYKLHY